VRVFFIQETRPQGSLGLGRGEGTTWREDVRLKRGEGNPRHRANVEPSQP